MTPVLNHLWQSTLFAVAVIILTQMLRKNSASVRYWLWFAASLKFIVPFSLVVAAGNYVQWRSAPPVTQRVTAITAQVTQPLTQPFTHVQVTPTQEATTPYLPVLWALGSLLILASWTRKAYKLRTVLKHSTPHSDFVAPIPVRVTSTLIEPGVVGVFRPVLLIPDGLQHKLNSAQLQAIVAHEMCHVRRRDNLLATFHMAIETIFWFHPLVWWIGSRLIEERERACDEEVLRLGNSPETYAESILSVCKFYLQSPLPCASGVTGADLKARVLHIMSNGLAQSLTLPRKLLIAAVAVSVIALPLITGAIRATAQPTGTAKYDVASIRVNESGSNGSSIGPAPGGGIRMVNVPALDLVKFAYDVRDFQVEGGPGWFRNTHFDLTAKQDIAETIHPRDMNAAQRLAHINKHRECMRNLLRERFNLTLQRDLKERSGYVLTTTGSHKLRPSSVPEQNQSMHRNMGDARSELKGEGADLATIASALSDILGRKVVDQTQLKGFYDFGFQWTRDVAQDTVASNEASIFTAIQEQLGLKLESRKVPTEILTITQIDKPTAN